MATKYSNKQEYLLKPKLSSNVKKDFKYVQIFKQIKGRIIFVKIIISKTKAGAMTKNRSYLKNNQLEILEIKMSHSETKYDIVFV